MDEREKSGAQNNDLIDSLVVLRNEDKDKTFSTTNMGIVNIFIVFMFRLLF